MNTTSPAPARLRIIIEGSDRLPVFSPEFEAYADHVAKLGITPDMLHPVIDLLLRQRALTDASNRGWTRALAIELAAEQADEFRRLGLEYQLDLLNMALRNEGDAARWCLYFVQLDQTDVVLRELTIPGVDVAVRHATRTTQRRRSRRR